MTHAPTATNIRDALDFLPADCDRDTWVRIGMAINAALGDSGFALWDEWSQGADSYREADARAAWRSFRADGKVQAGSLFHLAKAAGYRPDPDPPPPFPPTCPPPPIRPAAEAEREAARRAELDRHRHAAQKAWGMWCNAPAARRHAYLTAKRIQPHGTRLFRGALLVPLYEGPGRLVNLQLIQTDGGKRFLAGGRKSGCYWWIGKAVTEILCLAEGFATAASLHEATGYRVYIAFDAGNLPHVAAALREQLPEARMVICADHDATGLKFAGRAAMNSGAGLAIPPTPGHDFNDMASELNRGSHG